jgi:hypothetical protein
MQASATILEKIGRLLINLNIDLPIWGWVAISLLGIYPKE